MMIEAGDFIDLGLGEPHFFSQCTQMTGLQAAKSILDFVKVLDEQIGAARFVAQQCLDFA